MNMNPHLNWGTERAAELRAEAQRDRLARAAQASRPQTRWKTRWKFLRFLLPARRPRLT